MQSSFEVPEDHQREETQVLSVGQVAIENHKTLPLEGESGVENQKTQLLGEVPATPILANFDFSGQEHRAQVVTSRTEHIAVTNQTTLLLAQTIENSSELAKKSQAKPVPDSRVKQLIKAGLARLQEPQPEGLLTRGLMQAVRSKNSLEVLPVLMLTNAFALFIVSLSYSLSVSELSYSVVESTFLVGMLLLFLPNAIRLLSPNPSRVERLALLCILSGYCFCVRFMVSPQHFANFDDFLHYRTADDILRTRHLFSINSLLPVSPYYAGLEIVTNAISTLTGLSTYNASIVITISSYLLLSLSLFLLYEQLTGSSRMAGIASIIYTTNQHFIFFDTIYNYETLALPLGLFMVYILVRYAKVSRNYRLVNITVWIVLCAVTITHHMTDYFFDGLLLFWAIVSFFQPASRYLRIHLTALAIAGTGLALAYAFLMPGNPVWMYLSQYFGGTFNQLQQIITRTTVARPLFSSTTQVAPVWDRLLMTGTVVLITFALPFGLLSLQRQHRSSALAVVFGLVSLGYPITQAFRFTTFGTEITDRAAAFLFLPVAYVLTILVTHFWPTRRLTMRAISLLSGAFAILLVGGLIVSLGSNLGTLAGPYEVSADNRSVEPEGIEAALWSLTYLGPDNRIATDRTNQMLMSTYGHQRIVSHIQDNINVAPIFSTPGLNSDDIALLRYGEISLLVVDLRLSTGLPVVGTYFEDDRPTSIIDKDALLKFDAIPQMNKFFDSGNIAIYDTASFLTSTVP